jgi:septal ring factor EnvC (AmiA/AmiB activator)
MLERSHTSFWLALGACLVTATATAYVPQKKSPAAPTASERDFERMLKSLDAKQNKLEKEIEELGPRIALVEKRTIARGRAYYRMVRAGLLPVGGGFDALVDHAAAVERLRAALARDIELSRSLKRRLVNAKAELNKLKAERAPLTIQQQAMNRAKSVMKQADERREAFLRAFGQRSHSPHVAIYGTDKGSASLAARFSEMRGRLSMPLSGRSEILTPITPGDHLTLRIAASRDTAVRSVYPGRVAFVGKTHHGKTVVLDHGEGYFTVYGNLHHIEVKTEETVTERARLGWVLRFGDNRPTLLFEVRRGKKLLDASKWLGL